MKANGERITMKHHVGKNEPKRRDENGRRDERSGEKCFRKSKAIEGKK